MKAEEREAALRLAEKIHRTAGLHPDAQVPDLVAKLAEQGLWSMQQIAKIVGVDIQRVRRHMSKPTRTGGRFNPATLPLIIEELELAKTGESNPLLTAEIWNRGTSPGFLATLLGQPVSTVQWRAARGREMKEQAGD